MSIFRTGTRRDWDALNHELAIEPPESFRRALQDSGLSVNTRGPKGRTLLHEACWLASEHEDLPQPDAMTKVRDLLELGADIHAVDKHGFTPLFDACSGDGGAPAPTVVTMLIERGADPNHQDHEGMTPLHSLATMLMIEASVMAAERLIQAGGRLDIPSKTGKTPWDHAVEYGWFEDGPPPVASLEGLREIAHRLADPSD